MFTVVTEDEVHPVGQVACLNLRPPPLASRTQSSTGSAVNHDLPMLTKPISVEVPTPDVVLDRCLAQPVVQENLIEK